MKTVNKFIEVRFGHKISLELDTLLFSYDVFPLKNIDLDIKYALK